MEVSGGKRVSDSLCSRVDWWTETEVVVRTENEPDEVNGGLMH